MNEEQFKKIKQRILAQTLENSKDYVESDLMRLWEEISKEEEPEVKKNILGL